MKKKILSMVLVVAMLASMLVLAPVSGATKFDGTVAVTNAYGFEGEPVSVDVVLTTDQPVYTFQFTFDYDKTKMTLDSVEFAPGSGFWPISGVKEVDEAMKVSPFDNIGWNRAVGADPIDASEGAVIATMNFTLNEDVLGDAYVSIVPSPINNIAIDSGEVGAMIYNFDYIAGAVTILPEGYVSASTDLSDFTISNGVLTKYTGDADVVVIPSSVTKIQSQALENISAKVVIIPASVTEIALGAILNCNYLSAVYILGDNVTFGAGAIGCFGTVNKTTTGRPPNQKITYSWAGDYYVDTDLDPDDGVDEYVVVTTIYGKAGSTAEDYTKTEVQGAYLGWGESNLCAVDYNENTYYVPANTVAPGMTEVGGKLAVAWKDQNGTVYAAGATMALTGDTELEPITIAKPDMTSTYGFKPTDSPATTAMRFTTTLAKADYETFAGVAESLGGRVEMGTLITPARFVSKAGALTKEALDALSASNNNAQTYIDIDTTGKYFSLEDNIYTFAGSVYGFKGTNYNLDYAAAFYMSVVVGEGETEETLFTVYSDFEFANNRQPLATAKAVYEVATTNAVKEAVLKFIQKYEPTYGEES